VKKCRFFSGKSTNGNRRHANCKCPVWVDGYLNDIRVNKSLDVQSWTRGNGIIRDWENAGTIQPKEPVGIAVRDANAFIADADARQLSQASLRKYRVLLINKYEAEERKKFSPSLAQFCAETGIQFTNQITLPVLTTFRAAWKDGALAGSKKLERMRAVGQFFVDCGWWTQNLASKLKRPKVTDPPTMPFTRDEIVALLSACDRFTDWHGRTGQENAQRIWAFILFLKYSGPRIGDAASCAVERLAGHKLFLYTQKTGVPVYNPLPPYVVEVLASCPRKSERYWFWTGQGSKETLAGNWRRTFRRLCVVAGVKGGHPHRFRDTLAVELLLAGVPMERVSILLGHSSVKITQRHYAPWVQDRQAQLESDLERVWRQDPLVQAAMLGGNTPPSDIRGRKMAATYPRHVKYEAPN
jgi:integrase